ncbi:MAG: hypothetical protein ACREP8_03875 [Candidatus Binatia bacterium]
MKKWMTSLAILSVAMACLTLPQEGKALDTVVVGQPYYGFGPYYGGFYGGGFYGGVPYSPNPALQNYVVGGNPLLLGNLSGYAGGPARQAQINRAFNQTAPILLTPNPVDAGTYGSGFYPYANPYYGGPGVYNYPYGGGGTAAVY